MSHLHELTTYDVSLANLASRQVSFAYAEVLIALGQRDEALELLRSDLNSLEKAVGTSHPLIMPLCLATARAYLNVGESKEAMQWAGRAFSLSKRHLGASSPFTAAGSTVQAACLVMQGNIQEATKRFTLARDLKLRGGWLVGNESVCEDIQGYAHVLGLSGKYPAAMELLIKVAAARAEYAESGHPRGAASMTVDGLRVTFLAEQVHTQTACLPTSCIMYLL